MKNCDELFDRDEFSAAPDAGWPDCFNSGVFVFKPSLETYKVILALSILAFLIQDLGPGLLKIIFSISLSYTGL